MFHIDFTSCFNPTMSIIISADEYGGLVKHTQCFYVLNLLFISNVASFDELFNDK